MRFLGGIAGYEGVKTITQAQFKKLRKIEYAAGDYAWKLKGDWSSSVVLSRYYDKWETYAESLGILYGSEVRYKVQGMDKKGDYSHGYTLGDMMA
jgi:hypothetical protein